jgi:NAD(P)-dependent dehydrogenase (short-subunit alcohol dehydrogenase family)
MSLDAFNHVMSVNVTAVFQCCQEAIRIMKEQVPPGGRYVACRFLYQIYQCVDVLLTNLRIINNGSVSAHVPRPLSAPYTMSKHAIWGLTKTIALDYRSFNIACSQVDIGRSFHQSVQRGRTRLTHTHPGNAQSSMSDAKPKGVLQADGSVRSEPSVQSRHLPHTSLTPN